MEETIGEKKDEGKKRAKGRRKMTLKRETIRLIIRKSIEFCEA